MRIFFGFVLLLAGCVSAEQNAKTCEGYGFTPKTDNFAQCMMKLDTNQSEKRVAVGAAFQRAGNNYSAAMQPRTVQANCTYNHLGGTVYQQCR